MVEWAGLENRNTRKCIVGSNPTLSANTKRIYLIKTILITTTPFYLRSNIRFGIMRAPITADIAPSHQDALQRTGRAGGAEAWTAAQARSVATGRGRVPWK